MLILFLTLLCSSILQINSMHKIEKIDFNSISNDVLETYILSPLLPNIFFPQETVVPKNAKELYELVKMTHFRNIPPEEKKIAYCLLQTCKRFNALINPRLYDIESKSMAILEKITPYNASFFLDCLCNTLEGVTFFFPLHNIPTNNLTLSEKLFPKDTQLSIAKSWYGWRTDQKDCLIITLNITDHPTCISCSDLNARITEITPDCISNFIKYLRKICTSKNSSTENAEISFNYYFSIKKCTITGIEALTLYDAVNQMMLLEKKDFIKETEKTFKNLFNLQ